MLVGVVVINSKNRFLILKRKVGNQIDLGLISGEVEKDSALLDIRNLLINETGVDFLQDLADKPLLSGVDEDGEFLILSCEKDFKEELKISNTEFLWLTFDRIKKLFNEGRLNGDQFYVLEKAKYFYQKRTKTNHQAMKVNHVEQKFEKLALRNEFEDYIEKFTDIRLFLRLVHRRKINPCGRECREYGYLIANEFSNHSSFENFPELMNNEEFILEIARSSRNPAECPIYFYDYVNPYLKKKKDFRLKFLKQIYLNNNVYKLEDIKTIVEYLQMQKENEMILADLEFRKLFEQRLAELNYQEELDYHCSGLDEKELRKYKIKANELKVLYDNMKKGLEAILETFTVGKKENRYDEEPATYYEMLCQQAFRK